MDFSTSNPVYASTSRTILSTSIHSSRGVHPKAQAHVVQLIGYMFHAVGKLGHVWLKRSICCSTGGPAIIEDNVIIPKISQTIINDFLGGPQEQRLANVASKGIPIVL